MKELFQKPVLITIGVFSLVVLLVNMFIDEPEFNKLSDRVIFELKTNHPEKADITFFRLVQENVFNIEIIVTTLITILKFQIVTRMIMLLTVTGTTVPFAHFTKN
ncbi:MAG: hypothetical protein HC830_05135 [Bacteroidetes bacterium]|nr:hypothetical protein [Bacteroidota bacterium]